MNQVRLKWPWRATVLPPTPCSEAFEESSWPTVLAVSLGCSRKLQHPDRSCWQEDVPSAHVSVGCRYRWIYRDVTRHELVLTTPQVSAHSSEFSVIASPLVSKIVFTDEGLVFLLSPLVFFFFLAILGSRKEQMNNSGHFVSQLIYF